MRRDNLRLTPYSWNAWVQVVSLVEDLNSTDDDTVEEAARDLTRLAVDNHMRKQIVAAGVLAPMAALLRQSSAGVAASAALLLMHICGDSLSSSGKIEAAGVVAPLVAQLRHSSAGVAEQAAAALGNLSAGKGDNSRKY